MTSRQPRGGITRERYEKVKLQLGWEWATKWPVSEHVRLWACAAERLIAALATAEARAEKAEQLVCDGREVLLAMKAERDALKKRVEEWAMLLGHGPCANLDSIGRSIEAVLNTCVLLGTTATESREDRDIE